MGCGLPRSGALRPAALAASAALHLFIAAGWPDALPGVRRSPEPGPSEPVAWVWIVPRSTPIAAPVTASVAAPAVAPAPAERPHSLPPFPSAAPAAPAPGGFAAAPATEAASAAPLQAAFLSPESLDWPATPRSAPDFSRLAGVPISGLPVRLRLYVDANGQVLRVETLAASALDAELAQRLSDTLLETAFLPGRYGGVDRASYLDLEFSFDPE